MTDSYLPAYIKSQNRRVVLDLFRRHGVLTRASICTHTGMSFPTAIKIIDFLMAKGIVQETADRPNGSAPGRKGKLLRFNPEAYRAIGLLFEGQYACVGLVNMNGDLIEQAAMNVAWRDGLPDLKEAAALIRQMCERNQQSPILGVGIGFPGIIDPDSASIVQYYNMGLNESRSFAELFPDFTGAVGLPYFLENDVNLACVGELFRRRQQGEVNDLVYLSLGTGLGGGIVLDGTLRRGARGRTGEVGEMLTELPQTGLPPRRMEQVVNLNAIRQRFGIDIHRAMPLDEESRAGIADYLAGPLTLLMANLSVALDVPDFVLAGIVPEVLGDVLYRRLNAGFEAAGLPGTRVSPPVNPCPGITGGAATVFDNAIFDVLSGD